MTLKPFTPDQARAFYAALPRKVCMAGVVVLNDAGQVLLVKPSYKDGWLVPGGAVNAFESPRAGAIREACEEIGDCVDVHRLLSVDFETRDDVDVEIMHYLFEGTLRDGTAITVNGHEIVNYKWTDIRDVAHDVPSGLAACLAGAVQCFGTGRVEYREQGVLK